MRSTSPTRWNAAAHLRHRRPLRDDQRRYPPRADRDLRHRCDHAEPGRRAARRDLGQRTRSSPRKVDTDEWAVAAGALYKLTDTVNLYANASRGFFFPEIRAVAFSTRRRAARASYNAEIIKQAEAGVKYSNGAGPARSPGSTPS